MNGTPLPPKKEVALALLERGSVHVHLDPRAGGVVVPAWFKRQPQLVLQVGLNMAVPIPDLRVDEDGLSCTLSFNRSPFFCVVPWSGVYAMVGDDGRGMVWPEDVPPEVALQARSREAEPAAKPAVKRALSAVPDDPSRNAAHPSKPQRSTKSKPAAVAAVAAVAPVRDAADPSATKKPRVRKPRPETAPAPKAAKRGSTAPKSPPKGRGVLVPVPAAAESPKSARSAKPDAAGTSQTSAPRPNVAASTPVESAPRPQPGRSIQPSRVSSAPPTKPAATTNAPSAPQPSPSRDGSPSPSPATAPRKPAGGKTKREIPPYLRVVK